MHLRLDENGNFLSLDEDPLNGGSRYDSAAIDAADNIYFVGAAGFSGTKAFVRWAGVGGTLLGPRRGLHRPLTPPGATPRPTRKAASWSSGCVEHRHGHPHRSSVDTFPPAGTTSI